MTSVPDGWTTEPFCDVATYAAGRTPARATAAYWSGTGERYPWVSIADMDDYGNVTQTKETITEGALRDVFRGRLVPAGTLIMSFKLTIGRVATLGVPACHNEAIIAIYPREDIDQRFLGYFLSQFDYSELQDRAIKGQTLNQDKIDRIPVLLPPASERRAIADVLDFVRRGAQVEEQSERVAIQIKQVAMRELFTRGLRGESQKETEIGPIPASWRIAALSEVACLERGRFLHRPRNEPRFYGGQVPFVQTGDVVRSNGHIRTYTQSLNEQGVAISRVFSAGTILITIAANIGYTGILEFDAACPDSLVGISPRHGVNTGYLNHYLQTQRQSMDAAAPKGTQKNLNIQLLSPWPVAVPGRDEQDDIVAILDAIDRKISLHRRKKAVLEELFKSLLHKLMTGEVRVGALDLSALPALEEARS